MNAALARFDEEFKQANSYEILGIKVLKWIFTFLGMGLMITIPFPTDKIMLLITWSFLWICVMWHVREKCYFMQGGKRISVYKIIGSTPINRKMYIKNRNNPAFCNNAVQLTLFKSLLLNSIIYRIENKCFSIVPQTALYHILLPLFALTYPCVHNRRCS